jgi:phytoene dehydrogenase-like protein
MAGRHDWDEFKALTSNGTIEHLSVKSSRGSRPRGGFGCSTPLDFERRPDAAEGANTACSKSWRARRSFPRVGALEERGGAYLDGASTHPGGEVRTRLHPLYHGNLIALRGEIS